MERHRACNDRAATLSAARLIDVVGGTSPKAAWAVDLLKLVYDRFSARDMETVLAALHDDVIWANGMEGGHVHGRDEVRNYWTRQWTMVDPHVEPVAFARGPQGEMIVKVPR